MAESGNTQLDQVTDVGLVKPGDVHVKKIELHVNETTNVDLSNFFVELHLYEDMFSPTLHGTVLIRDAQNLIGRLPIVGSETLSLEIITPSMATNAPVDYINRFQKTFLVYSLTNRTLNAEKEQYYELNFCSLEAGVDNVTRISKTFEGSTDELAEAIFTEYLVQERDNVAFGATYSGIQSNMIISDTPHKSKLKFVSPMWTPIKCLQWLAARSLGNTRESPTYLFYETTKGFYFVSVEDLIASQMENNAIFSEYFYQTPLMNLQTDIALNKGFTTVEHIEFLTQLDVLKGQDLGHFASLTTVYDLVKKEYINYSYDHGFQFAENNHLETYKLTNNNNTVSYVKDETKKWNTIFPVTVNRSIDSKRFFTTIHPGLLNSTEDTIDLHPEKYVPKRNSSLMDISTLRIKISVPGRTDAECGKIIHLWYPSTQPKDDKKTPVAADLWDNLVSGYYLITAIHHQISPLRHTMHMEIAKDSYKNAIIDVSADQETPAPATAPSDAPTQKPVAPANTTTTPKT